VARSVSTGIIAAGCHRQSLSAVFYRQFRLQEGCKPVAEGFLRAARNAQNPCIYA